MNRINFYPQKYGKTAKLVPADFNTLQDYIQAAIESAVKDMMPLPACLSALDMVVTPNGDWRVVVSAGAGYDETGKRVYNEAGKLLDLGPVMYPVGVGNERYLRVVARAAVNQQEPREDAYGTTVYFRQIEAAELAVRAGVEAPIGTATVPDAQAGDITRAVVRRYDGQLRIEAGDIDNNYADTLANFVRQGSVFIGNVIGNADTATLAEAAKGSTRFWTSGCIGGNPESTYSIPIATERIIQYIYRSIPSGKVLKLKRISCFFSSIITLKIYANSDPEPRWVYVTQFEDSPFDVILAAEGNHSMKISIMNSQLESITLYPYDSWWFEFAIE